MRNSVACPALLTGRPSHYPGPATCQPRGRRGRGGAGDVALGRGTGDRTIRGTGILGEELAEPSPRAIPRSTAPPQPPRGPGPPAVSRAPPLPADSLGLWRRQPPPPPHGAAQAPHSTSWGGAAASPPRGVSYLLILSANARRSALGSVAMARRRLFGL